MSDIFIDRRLNPKGKSLGNRQRFIKKIGEAAKKAVKDAIENKNIQDIGNGEKVVIPAGDISQPRIGHNPKSGVNNRVLSGNKEFIEGDTIDKPKSGGGGSGGNEGSPDGQGDDDFVFVLNRDEFLDLFFEDLELPDLVKKDMKKTHNYTYQHTGYTNIGSPANLDVEKSFKSSMGRRIALRRPSNEEIEELEQELFFLLGDPEKNKNDIIDLEEKIERLRRKQKQIPYFDDVDLKYRMFKKQPNPSTNAVMFCLLDVSYSMDETKKDWAKRFFTILYLFLTRHYKQVEIVFIRHHTEAEEVPEKEFFEGIASGGTVVSTAIRKMHEIIKERYPLDAWNIYAGQASDGDNYTDDNPKVIEMLNEVLPIIQYYAYVQISSSNQQIMNHFTQVIGNMNNLWGIYSKVSKEHPKLQLKHISEKKDIWAVFRELFEKKAK